MNLRKFTYIFNKVNYIQIVCLAFLDAKKGDDMLNFPIKINGQTIQSQDIYRQYRDGLNAERSISFVIEKTGANYEDASDVVKDVIEFYKEQRAPSKVVENPEFRAVREYNPEPSSLRCPRCSSSAITTGPRGVNWISGFIGASTTVNRCGNCGHTWKPRR